MNGLNKFASLITVTGGMLLLTSCGPDPQEASIRNFERVLNDHFQANPECYTYASFKQVDGEYVQEFSDSLTEILKWGRAEPYIALEKLGMVAAEEITVSNEYTNKPEPAVKFTLTETGEAALNPATKNSNDPELCYGNREVTVTNFSEPAVSMMGVKASMVKYTYTIPNIADWATSIEYKPYDPSAVEETGEHLVHTQNGWMLFDEFSK